MITYYENERKVGPVGGHGMRQPYSLTQVLVHLFIHLLPIYIYYATERETKCHDKT